MSVKCILQGQDTESIKLEKGKLIQRLKDVTQDVQDAIGVAKHASTHAIGGDDLLSPSDIGAAASSHTHDTNNITSGTLGVARGGTGVTSNPSMLINLASTSAANVFAASPRPGVTGTLPVANGGTGATTLTSGAALIGNGTSAVAFRSITNNTSASTAVPASTNLITANTLRYALNRTTAVTGADTNYTTAMVRAIKASTTDLTAGTSSLTNGTIYVVYE